MHWYVDVLKKYAEFSGRARREEYWMFTLINIIIYVVLYAADYATGLGFLALIYSLAVLLPSIAVGVRRLHDTNRPGLWYLIILVPCVGAIVLIVFFVQDSDSGENQYGPNPKGA